MIATAQTRRPQARDPDPNELARQLIGRDYLSHSAISTYQRCPLKFYFRYVEQLPPEFRSSSLIFGSAIHAAIEQHYRCLFEGVTQPAVDDLLEIYNLKWQSEANEPIRYGKDETAESLLELAGRMLRVFLASELSNPETRLLGVEEEFRAAVIPDCPDLLGRVDLLDLTCGALRITDFKTSRCRWKESQIAEAGPQMALYSVLVQPLADALGIQEIESCWIVLTKTKQPSVTCHTAKPDPMAVRRVLGTVRQVWRAIRNESFYPAPSAMNCAGCAFQNACQQWEGHIETESPEILAPCRS